MTRIITALLIFMLTLVGSAGAAEAGSMSSHTAHSLILTEDGIVSFGKNTFAQLGDGTDQDSYTPVPVLGFPQETFISVEAGEKHSFALTESGRVYGWGSNYSGELGTDPDGGQFLSPSPVLGYEKQGDRFVEVPLTGVTMIAAGSDHTIAIREDGSLWSWGRNDHHQLGQHSYIPTGTKYIAQKVETAQSFTQVVSYENHNFVLDEKGRVWGFGQNITRMFQTGESKSKDLQLIKGLPEITQIETGASHALALDTEGKVWTWGYNYFGQNRDTPELVENLPPVASIATGHTHNLALTREGDVYGWGENNYGELTGTEELKEIPTRISLPGVNISEIEAGKNFSLAKTSKGDLYAWGRNDYGQLGDGSGQHQTAPVFVSMQEVEAVVIEESRIFLAKGETRKVEAKVLPEDARNKRLYWTSSNEDVATVENGEITAVGNDPSASETIITATSANGKHKDSVRVLLRVPVAGVDIVKQALTLERVWTDDGLSDETYQLEANVYPSTATDKRLMWTTSDPEVVTVDPQGTLHSRKTGTATVTATAIDGGYKDTIPITVTIPVSEIHIRGAASGLKLWEGQSRKLDYYTYPINATEQDVLDWSSSDPSVVSVDYFGNVTAHKPGVAEVTVTSVNKRKKGSISINVEQGAPVALSGFSVEETSLTLPAKSEKRIAHTFYPANASDRRVSWTSEDPSIATVTSEGNVRGIANGTTTIRAVTKDGGFEREITVNVGASDDGWVIFPEKSDVPRDKRWTIEFNTPLSAETINPDSVYIQDIRGRKVESRLEYKNSNVTIQPMRRLEADSFYYLIVNDEVTSETSAPLKHNVHFLFQTKE